MSRSRYIVRAAVLLSLVSGAALTQPALAAEDHRLHQFEETRTSAFAGLRLRVETGPRAKPQPPRFGIGLRSISTARHSEAPMRIAHAPLLELGVGGREGGSLFLGGQKSPDLERRLGVDGRVRSTAIVIGTVALVVVGLIVITNLDGLDTDD